MSDKRDAKPHLERSHRSLRFGGQKSICGSTGKTVCRPVIPIFGIGPVGAKEAGGQQDPIEPATPFSPVKLCRKGQDNTIGRYPEKLIRKILISRCVSPLARPANRLRESFIVASVVDAMPVRLGPATATAATALRLLKCLVHSSLPLCEKRLAAARDFGRDWGGGRRSWSWFLSVFMPRSG